MTTIHSALLPHNVSMVRRSLQSFARRALAARSWRGLSTYVIDKLLETVEHEEGLGLLPVIYATLDPSLIPSTDILDTLSMTEPPTPVLIAESATVTLSFLGLMMTGNRQFPFACTIDIWPRLWKWVEFLEPYSECPAAVYHQLQAAAALYQPLARIMNAFLEQPQTHRAMAKTRGVHRVLAVGWNVLLQAGSSGTQDDVSHRLSAVGESPCVLTRLRGTKGTADGQTEKLSKIVEGCGGSHEGLLLALTRTISLVSAHSEYRGASTAFSGLALFLHHIQEVSPDTFLYILNNRFISAWLATLDIEIRGLHVASKLGPLVRLLNVTDGYRWVLEALRAGLLDPLLEKALPLSLVSYSVIVDMKAAFSRLETDARKENFTRSLLYPMWSKLKALVDERARVVEGWDASGRAQYLGCYNLRCDSIGKKQLFRRCSVCNIAAYCSPTCQRADWKDGHREDCHIFLHSLNGLLRYRERSFIRALITHDSRRLHTTIAKNMVRFMAKNPDTPFTVFLDYGDADAESGVDVPVSPLSKLKLAHPHPARVAHANGRLVIYWIRLPLGGPTGSDAIWPLRFTSLSFYDGLVRISHQVNGLDDEEVEGLVQNLIKEMGEENAEWC
ncbi:hypothetical protein FB45DRAFT_1059628 [Roridomyces roridus]|uniref:MYND-type domain-containing protein n=1 Tax=Roridomyces roridus TaxID=1738132 RepID=A0AAD7FKG8_9AGAR|nr:hypothetical protein FB45DRAFT_1059628 [Roridomyces roridus]